MATDATTAVAPIISRTFENTSDKNIQKIHYTVSALIVVNCTNSVGMTFKTIIKSLLLVSLTWFK